MKHILFAVSAAALTISMPASAEAQGKGKGAAAKANKSSIHRNAKSNGQVRTDVRARTDARANVRARTRTGASIVRADTNMDGRIDARDRVDLNGDGVDDRAQNRYAGNVCPPGLANRTPACVPPGQAKRMFNEGQRIPVGYDHFTDYNMIPEAYRSQVPYVASNRYIYRDNIVYVVDPTTRLVTSIVNLIR